MNKDDLEEYIKNNSRAYTIFINKALEFQQNKNAGRALKSRFSDVKVEREANKMWTDTLAKFHTNLMISQELKKKSYQNWVDKIKDNDILDIFEESMSDLDFDAV